MRRELATEAEAPTMCIHVIPRSLLLDCGDGGSWADQVKSQDTSRFVRYGAREMSPSHKADLTAAEIVITSLHLWETFSMDFDTKALAPLDRSSFIPLYRQLTDSIGRLIRSGKVPSGTLLPSEHECSQLFGISRLTVRQAMAQLVTDGLVIRERGRGTYVRSARVMHNFNYSFEEEILADNRLLSLQTLSWTRVRPSQAIAQALSIPPKSWVHKLERLKIVDDAPIGWEVRYLLGWIGAGISASCLKSDPVYKLMQEAAGVSVARIASTVGTVPASRKHAQLLRVREGAPLLVREQTYFGNDDAPLMHGTVMFRGDRYQFRFQYGPEQLHMGPDSRKKNPRHRHRPEASKSRFARS